MWFLPFSKPSMFVVLMTLAVGSNAAAQEGGHDAELRQLSESRAAVRYDLTMPKTTRRAGGAMLMVNAPAAVVKQVVTDYGHYHEFVPGFTKSRILARGPSGTDVYLQAPILHGAATLWSVVRFGPSERDGTGDRIEGHKAGQGNLEDFRATWRIIPVDAGHTVLKLELLMVPNLPLPESMITPQLAESAEDTIIACRTRAESQELSSAAPNR